MVRELGDGLATGVVEDSLLLLLRSTEVEVEFFVPLAPSTLNRSTLTLTIFSIAAPDKHNRKIWTIEATVSTKIATKTIIFGRILGGEVSKSSTLEERRPTKTDAHNQSKRRSVFLFFGSCLSLVRILPSAKALEACSRGRGDISFACCHNGT